ncbi:MAG: hypothetical protein R3E86_04985 [Pseudomonadales bacterium]
MGEWDLEPRRERAQGQHQGLLDHELSEFDLAAWEPDEAEAAFLAEEACPERFATALRAALERSRMAAERPDWL